MKRQFFSLFYCQDNIF